LTSALIVVDMLNHYEHPDADLLMESVRERLPAVCELIERARDADALTIYVNDNHGDWSAGRPEVSERALAGRAPELIEPILPDPSLPFVVKARHSIFYETQLEYLLRQEEIERIVLTGQVTEQCILYSSLDAYVRHFSVGVAEDAVAHIHPDLAEAAVRMMERNMNAEIASARSVDF
jgi:nicotinamidase-related amidase